MLKKGPRVVVTPGVAGSPAIAERVVCPSQPPDSAPKPRSRNGYFQTLCRPLSVIVNTEDGPKLVVFDGQGICSTVWIET